MATACLQPSPAVLITPHEALVEVQLTSIQTILLITQHEHHLPLKHTVPHQSATDARDVLVCLHLLELSPEEDGGGGGRGGGAGR